MSDRIVVQELGQGAIVEDDDSGATHVLAGENTLAAAASANRAEDEADRAEQEADRAQTWAEGTEPGGPGTKSAREWAEQAEAAADSIALAPLLEQTPTLTRTTALADQNRLVLTTYEGAPYQVLLADLAEYILGHPLYQITGPRLAVIGDSRSDNGLIAQSGVSPAGFQTGNPEGIRLAGIHGWLLHALGWPMEVVGQWTQGGGKSSQFCHDHALRVIAARQPDAVIYLGTTNDPVDYTGSGGLGPILLGDPNAPPASQPRVGDRAPVGAGIGTQGTTIGNLDKMLRFFGDPVANGLGRMVPVICFEIPTDNAGRKARNIAVHQWLQARAADRTYRNLIAPDVFTALLSNPADLTSTVRTDLNATIGTIMADPVDFLHPSPAGARFIGETMAADSRVAAALAGRPGRVVLPNGSNDSLFLNANPTVSVGDGSGVLGYSASPAPTGTVAQGYELVHDISTGTRSVTASFSSGEQVITISRTGGGSDPTVPRTVTLHSAEIPITPVAGDVYVLSAEVVVPARNPQDLFAVSCFINFQETGLLNDYGQDIQTGTYGAFQAQNPNYFPKDGDTLVIHSVPLEITPAMVASATGTIGLSARCQISFSDAMDTAANGNLVVTIRSMGIRKLAGAYAHTPPPAVPAAGAACTAAPTISGAVLVGRTITLGDATFASGTIASRRLLRDGVPVTFSGSTYTLTAADSGKRLVFECTSSTGTIAQSEAFGPVRTPSAELEALIDALDGNANNAIHDFTKARVIGSTWRTEDFSGLGNEAEQTATVRHPGIDTTLGAVLDGSNDCMGYTWPGSAPSTITAVLAMRKTVGHTGGRILSDGTATNSAGLYQSAITALPGTWTVDGASVTTQGQLFSALDDGAEHTVMVTGLNVSAWPAIFWSRSSGAVLGSMRRGVIIDEATSDIAGARTKAIAWVESGR